MSFSASKVRCSVEAHQMILFPFMKGIPCYRNNSIFCDNRSILRNQKWLESFLVPRAGKSLHHVQSRAAHHTIFLITFIHQVSKEPSPV